jgi:tyrosinase
MGNKNPPSVNRKVSEALQGKLAEIQQRLFILFSSYKTFNAFSNKVAAMQQGLSSWDSIESVHDIIHIYGGLKGHMTYVPLSSFDPMFFLHHTNTDRLVAMWQALNPTAWITPMAAGETSFTTLKGTVQDSSTPLTPFLISPEGDFWTSDLARVPEMFGYSYADTDVSNITSGEVRSRLVSNIVKWYGGSSPLSMEANIKPTLPNRAHIEMPMNNSAKAIIPNLKGSMRFATPASVFEDGHYTEWVANVRVNVEALDGLFGVHFFLGEPPKDTETWDTASNQIGSVGIFAMNRNTGSKSMISGTLPLTTALLRLVSAGIIPDVAPEAAQDWLQKNLRFAIKGSDDRVVDPEKEEVAGLYIMVTSSDVSMPSAEQPELPVWGNPIQRFEMWT